MGKKQERINQIIQILKETPDTGIKELADIFQVSEMTVRRDLAYLKEHDILSTTPQLSLSEHTVSFCAQDNEYAKIGELAASLLEPNDMIIVDSGEVSPYLTSSIAETLPVTLLCYDFQTLSSIYMRPHIQTIFAGGYYHTSNKVFESAEGIELIKKHRANKIFLTAEGVHMQLGITCSENYLVPVKQAGIASSATKILMVKSSAFGQVQPSYFAQLDDIDIIITDHALSSEWKDTLERSKILLYLA